MTQIYTFGLHIPFKTIIARMSIPYNKGFSSFAWFNGKRKIIKQQVSETITYSPII
jgi:hypothetical protein